MADALPKINDNVEGGKSLLELVVTAGNGRETVLLQKGEIEQIGEHNHLVGFEAEGEGVINIIEKDGAFKIHTHVDNVRNQGLGKAPRETWADTNSKTQVTGHAGRTNVASVATDTNLPTLSACGSPAESALDPLLLMLSCCSVNGGPSEPAAS